ncbi:histidine kinase [Algoriphagus sp. NG3]|uniref:sensor histidine kinase n=1 Tax=Algoriphagus sp. NG3 TaxID=3097546 RepID=UPI002A8093F1|nr:histidine kinase [Algoriphagus sp. NG3]WPR77190.1 histidine kinase [Algoriphagus sp. NG3]
MIFLFAYLDSIRSRVAPGQRINWYILTPESAIVSMVQALVIFLILRVSFQWLQSYPQLSIPWMKTVFSFGKGLLLFIVLSNVLSISLALLFGTWERNFLAGIQISNNISTILDFIIYGGFYVALLLYQQFKSQQLQLAAYDTALAEAKVTHLKQQLNPHFLFNNLNILDQLIEEDPKTASTFLQNFSELYRYALETSEKHLVGWQEELDFAKSYFNLIREKYGDAYQLEISVTNPKGKLPPLTLQLLLENAVFHNFGTSETPVTIKIQLGEKVIVSNTLLPFKRPKHHGGKGLENLRQQFRILGNEPVSIDQSDGLFTVSIPLIP